MMASALAISAGSLLGFPPLLGFWGKLAIFIAGVVTNHLPLVIIAGLNSAVSAWYYLRLVGLPLMSEPNERSDTVERVPVPWARLTAIVLVIALIVLPVFLASLRSLTFVSG